MGMGKIFKCENCGESFVTMMGIGMNFPFEYTKPNIIRTNIRQ